MKELNEKIVFVSLPQMHIELAPKREHDEVVYHFKKMSADEKTHNEYFVNKEFDKALKAFVAIQQNDSLNPVIKERNLNNLGYEHLSLNDYDTAL
jgi:hypothetical protein